jgi:imidazolonepropionase-like amidohydrolase
MECVKAGTVYTGAKVVRDAYVAFEGGKIAGVSKAKRGTLRGSFDTITPAFIDAHSHIGMFRAGEPAEESEGNEHMDSMLALPDALDSVQMDDTAFRAAIEQGVLYSCVVPGSGNIIGGYSAVIRHYGRTTSEALMARAGVKAAFGYNPMSTVEWKGKRPSTRMGAVAILRGQLDAVRQKILKKKALRGKKKDEVTFTAEESVLRDVLDRKERLRVHVHKIDDIASLLRVADEFGLNVTVEHAGDVHEPEIYRELRKRRIPVIYGPIDSHPYKVELKHESWRHARHLIDTGVQYGFMTDHPVTLSGTLFLQTRWFVRLGLSKQEAIELVSRKNAEILEIDDRLGSLEKGKWASMSCWNGDPFDMTAYPVRVYGEGSVLYEE